MPPRATPSGSTSSRSSRPTPAWTSSRSDSALIGHSHVSLFFTRSRGRRPRRDPRRPGRATDAPRPRRRLLADQPRQRRPAPRRRSAGRLARARHDAGPARFHRVAYDIERAAASIFSAGLPKRLADRLYVGSVTLSCREILAGDRCLDSRRCARSPHPCRARRLAAAAALALASCGGATPSSCPAKPRRRSAQTSTPSSAFDEGECVGAENAAQQVEQTDRRLGRNRPEAEAGARERGGKAQRSRRRMRGSRRRNGRGSDHRPRPKPRREARKRRKAEEKKGEEEEDEARKGRRRPKRPRRQSCPPQAKGEGKGQEKESAAGRRRPKKPGEALGRGRPGSAGGEGRMMAVGSPLGPL